MPRHDPITARPFDPDCRDCPRLVRHLATVRAAHPEYHARPVPAFGPVRARLLVVGLAPGMHGANRSGRPFTGDHAGILLYAALHAHGFASRAQSVAARDGLRLLDARITNAVRCLPPANRPQPDEIARCNGYLRHDLERVAAGGVVLALGRVAHDAVLRALGERPASHPFGHAREHPLPGERTLLDSYHCSRYNTQTRRLTEAMFDAVLARARSVLDVGGRD